MTFIVGVIFTTLKINVYLFFIDTTSEANVAPSFDINYSNGQHWSIYNDTTEQPTTVYVNGAYYEWLDHSYSNFGSPCTK